MNVLKDRVAADLYRQTGRHDERHVFAEPYGDPGLTGPQSVSWRIASDPATVLVAGLGAIVMEILHPSVMAGVHDLSGYREDPLRRGKTTFGYVVTTTFAGTPAATRLIGAVKRMHARVEGVRPDGVAYRALDPELIGWVHTCIPWGILRAHRLLHGPLSRRDGDAFLREQAVIGRMGGAGAIPETLAELEEYLQDIRPKLEVTDQTREFFEFLMVMPFGMPAPGPLSRPVHRMQIEAGMSVMPRWAQRLAGFESSPLARRAVHAPSLRNYARVVRWALGTPPWVALARERVAPAQARPVAVRVTPGRVRVNY